MSDRKHIPRQFQPFIKPVGSLCNMRCSYCYYSHSGGAGNCLSGPIHLMSESVLELLIKQNIEAAAGGTALFAWHGGEPTLAGIDFYRRAVELQSKYSRSDTVTINGIQTNGTLINEEWCRFLAENEFQVGVSIDGPRDLHNANRKSPTESDPFGRAANAFLMLQEHGVEPEVLCVVSSVNSGYPLDVYNLFRTLEAKSITFLPLVIRCPGSGEVTELSVNALDFGRFLTAVFDEWISRDVGRIRVQIFDEAVSVAFGREHTLCIFKRECGGVPVIEQNGDFYSCDHFVRDEYLVGNILTSTVGEMLDSKKQRDFGRDKQLSLPDYCFRCEVLDMCNGECPRNRFLCTPEGEEGLNYLCEGYKLFFNHCRPFVNAVAEAMTLR